MSQDTYLGGEQYSAGTLPLPYQRHPHDTQHYNTYGVSTISVLTPLL